MKPHRTRRRAFHILSAAVVAYSIAWLPLWLQPIFLMEIVKYPHATPTLAGVLLGAEVAALAIASALGARLFPNWSFRTLLLMGLALIAIGDLTGLMTVSLVQLLFTRLICGIGEGMALMVSYSALSGADDPDRAYAKLALWSTPLATVAMYLAPAIGTVSGGRQTLPTLLICLAVISPAAWLMPTSLRCCPPAQSSLSTFRGHSRAIALIWISAFLFLLINAITWPFYFVLGLNTGLSADQVNNAIVLSIIASMVGSLLTAVVGSRFGRRMPLAIGLALVAIGVVLMAHGSKPLLYLAGINLTMLASYFVVPYFAGFAATRDPSGRGAALVGVAGPVAFSLGTGAAGFLWEYGGKAAISGLAICASILAFVILNIVGGQMSGSGPVPIANAPAET